MTFQVVSRTDIGLDPVVRSSTGSPRPKLGFEPWATIHYTGVDVTYATRSTPQQILNIEKWAASKDKPNEYNYVIGQENDDKVYEYAGPYQAAHSAGENSESIGILLLNGNREPVTDLQIEKFRWLVSVLQYFAVLSGTCQIVQHYQMPGASTSCAKSVVGNRLPEFRVPWSVTPPPPPPPPPPSPPPSTDVGLFTLALEGDGWWSIARRVYGNNGVAAAAAALQAANKGNPLHPGTRVEVPGRAVI